MAFFKSQLLKIIEWQDDSKDTICYKFPMDGREIMYGSKLTVRESQVAIFMNKGEIADIFGPGMHKLETSNLPILTKILSLPYGFKSPFFSDVFFVNTKQFINQKWGTTNPITMRDNEFGNITIRGYGTYSFKVKKPESFLKELLGTNSNFTTSDVNDYLKSILISAITDAIAESNISALDLAANLNEFNALIKKSGEEHFDEVGLSLTKFIVENVSFPDEIQEALNQRAQMRIMKNDMGTFMQYQSAHAIRDAAKNEGGGVANIGVGLGTGMALGDMMRESIKGMKEDSSNHNAQVQPKKEEAKPAFFCPECGTGIMKKNAKFCPECGHKQEVKDNSCGKCGAEVKPNAKFCPECGNKLN